jgi:hypothetical protein
MKRLDQAFVDEMRRRIVEYRATIKVKETLDKLQACVDGTEFMSREQIRAAEILLKKAMPDMKEVEHNHVVNEDFAEYLAKARERANTARQH